MSNRTKIAISNRRAGRLIFIHLQCWEVLPFFTIQRQQCIKFRVLRARDFYAPLALNCQKGQHLPALEVYKNQSPKSAPPNRSRIASPKGPEKYLDAARQKLPRDTFCRSIALTTGTILKEENMSSIVGERQFGRHFKRQFGRGYLRVKNCRETVGIMPRGIKMSRRRSGSKSVGNVLSFLSLFIYIYNARKTTKTKDLLSLPSPQNPWKITDKHSKNKEVPCKGKKGNPPKKQRKDSVSVEIATEIEVMSDHCD